MQLQVHWAFIKQEYQWRDRFQIRDLLPLDPQRRDSYADIYVVDQFYPWFNFHSLCFKLIIINLGWNWNKTSVCISKTILSWIAFSSCWLRVCVMYFIAVNKVVVVSFPNFYLSLFVTWVGLSLKHWKFESWKKLATRHTKTAGNRYQIKAWTKLLRLGSNKMRFTLGRLKS